MTTSKPSFVADEWLRDFRHAADAKDEKKVNELLKEAHGRHDPDLVLSLACATRHIKIIEAALIHGSAARPDALRNELMRAIQHEWLDVLRLLLDNGGKGDMDALLSKACELGRQDMMMTLYGKGAKMCAHCQRPAGQHAYPESGACASVTSTPADHKEIDFIVSLLREPKRKEPYRKICKALSLGIKDSETIDALKGKIQKAVTGFDEPRLKALIETNDLKPVSPCKGEPRDLSYRRMATPEVIPLQLDVEHKEWEAATRSMLKMIDDAHNIMHSSDTHSAGEDAMHDIMNFMFIKCIQTFLSDKPEDGKIDLFNRSYYISESATLDRVFGYFADLKKLANEDVSVLRSGSDMDAIREMGEILTGHPMTRQIFSESNFIKVKDSHTIKRLIERIDKFDVSDFARYPDMIGIIYEHFVNGYTKNGGQLGQFFTPRKVMNLILAYKRDDIMRRVAEAKESYTIIDTCMGTAGWLVSAYAMLAPQYANKIQLAGIEVRPITFQYGVMNLIMALRKIPNDVTCASSLSHVKATKYDLLVTNPPFQGLKPFEDIMANFESNEATRLAGTKLSDVYTLCNNDAPTQFLELDIFKLKPNGLGIIIIPDGKMLFGRTFAKVRHHFMQLIGITDIIKIPSGAFESTTIKTCVMIFEKGRATTSINFGEMNDACTQLTRITTVSMADINKQSVGSWNVSDYLKDEDVPYDIDVKVMTLANACKFFPKSERKAGFGSPQGAYPFFTSSMVVRRFVDEPDYTTECVIIGTGGSPSVKYSERFSCSGDNIIITSKNQGVLTKYIYYFLLSNIKVLAGGFAGLGLEHISKEYVENIQVPIPPPSTQLSIITRMDAEHQAIATEQRRIADLGAKLELHKAELTTIFNTQLKPA